MSRDASFLLQLFGRPIQDNLPIHRRAFDEIHKQKFEQAKMKAKISDESQKKYYDQGVRILPEVKAGQTVAVYNNVSRKWDIHGKVVQKLYTDHDTVRYKVRTAAGTIMTRNRRFIRERTPASVDYVHDNIRQGGGQDDPIMKKSTRQKVRTKRLVEDDDWC